MKTSTEIEKKAAMDVAAVMAAAARTAPKTRGIDNIKVFVIDDEPTKQRVMQKMAEISRREKRPSLERDAGNIAPSPAILVVGAASNPAELNCGYCGHKDCNGLRQAKGVCAFNSIDLGIAVCSAVSVAGQLHIDNRVMYSIGRACLELKMLGEDVKQALGIPLSVTGKNPYFDRKN